MNVNIDVHFNILLEQSNCALVGKIKRLDSIKNAWYNCENRTPVISAQTFNIQHISLANLDMRRSCEQNWKSTFQALRFIVPHVCLCYYCHILILGFIHQSCQT